MSIPRWHSLEDDGSTGVVSCYAGHVASREVFERLHDCPYCLRGPGRVVSPWPSAIAGSLRSLAAKTDLVNENPRAVTAAGGMDKRS